MPQVGLLLNAQSQCQMTDAEVMTTVRIQHGAGGDRQPNRNPGDGQYYEAGGYNFLFSLQRFHCAAASITTNFAQSGQRNGVALIGAT